MQFHELVEEQVERIEGCVAYYPKNKWLRKEMAHMMVSMIGPEVIQAVGRSWTQEQRLEWLCDALVRQVGKWPKNGLAELRGWYCIAFRPSDGIEGICEMDNPPKPARLSVDDSIPRIGASPVDVEFETHAPYSHDPMIGNGEFETAIELVAKAKHA